MVIIFRNELKKYDIQIYDVEKEVKELSDDLYEVIVYDFKLKTENRKCFTAKVNIKDRTVRLIQ